MQQSDCATRQMPLREEKKLIFSSCITPHTCYYLLAMPDLGVGGEPGRPAVSIEDRQITKLLIGFTVFVFAYSIVNAQFYVKYISSFFKMTQ